MYISVQLIDMWFAFLSSLHDVFEFTASLIITRSIVALIIGIKRISKRI